MKFGIGYAYWGTEWKCDYTAAIEKASDIGFDILEIGADHLYHMEKKELTRLKLLGGQRGMEFTTNSGPSGEYDLASPDPEVRKRGVEYFRQILHRMEQIGSKVLAGAIYSYWPADFALTDKGEAWKRSIEGIRKVGEAAEALGIECALEVLNRYETYILTDCAEAIDYVKQVGCEKVGILLDTYHMNIEEDDMYEAIRKAGKQLFHFHAGECNRKLPGMNHSIDWEEIGRALQDIHYERAVVMEPFLLQGGSVGRDIRVWRDLSNHARPEQMDQYLKDSLKYLKQCFPS